MANRPLGLLIAALIATPAFGQEPVVMSELISAPGEAPLPIVGAGAPNYSIEQMKSELCLAEATKVPGVIRNLADRAYQATVQAQQARVALRLGRISQRQAEQAEQARQQAVRAVAVNVTRKAQLPKPERDGVVIEHVVRRREVENGRPVLLVSGAVRNTTARQADLPALTVWTLDVRGFVLAAQTSDLGRASLAAGETMAFTVRLKNPPQYMADIHAGFAPPLQFRSMRSCDMILGGAQGDEYGAAELAGLSHTALQDAASAFAEAEIRKTPGGAHRERPARCDMPAWRDLLVYADLLDEAAIAARAAEEVRRDAARGVFTAEEVAAAEAARRRALSAALAARPPPHGPQGKADRSLRVEIDDTKSKVRIRGRTEADNAVLLLTVRDRLGRLTSETLLRLDMRGGRETSVFRPDGEYAFDTTVDYTPGLAHRVEVAVC